MAATQQHCGLRRDDLVDDGAEVSRVRSVPLAENHVHSDLLRVGLRGVNYRIRKGSILVDESNRSLRVLGLQRVEHTLQVFGGRSEHLEQVMVAQGISLAFRRARGEHDLAVLLGYDA